jgi:response regulator of citrate/malate metabolism
VGISLQNDFNGLWLIDRIRDKWTNTAVVVITGVDEMEIIEQSKKLGVVDYVLKPFGREALRQALERAASRTEKPSGPPV